MIHTGSCHCGKVKYEVDADFDSAISCNCSMCKRKGSLLGFVPVEKFKLLSGESSLKDYQFNKKIIHHYFCDTCGVTSFATGKGQDGAEMRAINIRCLENFDIDKLTIHHFDGAHIN